MTDRRYRGVARLLLAGVAVAMAMPSSLWASSHREAPFVTEHPKVDGTDFYMFRSYEEGREGFVTLIANYLPLQDAYGGPNYFELDPSAVYRINIENDGDGIEDISFDFVFRSRFLNQTLNIDGVEVGHPLRTISPLPPAGAANESYQYRVHVVRDGFSESAVNARTGGVFFAKTLDNFGAKTFSNYDAYASSLVIPIAVPGCDEGRVFVGQRKESFAVNLGEIFDLVNLNPVGDPAAKRSATEDKNVTTIALELPIACLNEGQGDVIGGWTTALLPRERSLKTDPSLLIPADEGGDLVQVSRLGMPLVNEVIIGLADKNRFNASHPSGDLAAFATYVTNPTIPTILNVLFSVVPPTTPRGDLVATFVTGLDGINNLGIGEMQRLNTAIAPTAHDAQSNMGVLGGDLAGFPNGRRPGDDVVDIVLQVAMGRLCHLGLGLCNPGDAPSGLLPFTDQTYQGADQFNAAFPYLKPPIPGSPNDYRVFTANLEGRQEVPPVDTAGSGACGAVLSPAGDSLAISCTHDLLDATAAHVHLAPSGVAGSVVCDFEGGGSPIQFQCPVDADFLAALQRGNTYVNVHTPQNQPGEIRGQLR